jgi:hypothetical protein
MSKVIEQNTIRVSFASERQTMAYLQAGLTVLLTFIPYDCFLITSWTLQNYTFLNQTKNPFKSK